MKKIPLLIFSILSFTSYAQKDNIHPIRVYCDSDYAVLNMLQNNDGSFITVGIDARNANLDGLIMKLDANYNVVWRKTYGGSQTDRLKYIEKINENRFLVAGEATSIDGDLAAYSWPFITASNVWLMIIDSNGNFIRGNTYGYGSSTGLAGIQLRSDGKIFISGSTVAEGGDFAGNPGNPLVSQTFVALTDTLLNKKWLRYIAGLASDDNVNASNALDKNGNLVLSIGSNSTSGDYAGLGVIWGLGSDPFLFCVDTAQNILWRKHYVGTDAIGITNMVIDSTNQIYIIAFTNSTDGDFFTNEVKWKSGGGNPSYCTLLKTDSIGNIIWKHAFGSFDTTMIESRNVEPNGLLITDHKIWVSSKIQGRDSIGEGFGWTAQLGAVDNWILQCDSNGILENKMRLGGKQSEVPWFISWNKIKHRPIIGMTSGGFGPITNFDCRVIKKFDSKMFEIDQWPTQVINITQPLNLIWSIAPNPSGGDLFVSFEKEFTGLLKIYDAEGKSIMELNLKNVLQKTINVGMYANGIYFFEISNKNGKQVKQMIINH